jgi:hypothetical protein
VPARLEEHDVYGTLVCITQTMSYTYSAHDAPLSPNTRWHAMQGSFSSTAPLDGDVDIDEEGKATEDASLQGGITNNTKHQTYTTTPLSSPHLRSSEATSDNGDVATPLFMLGRPL